ncbi:MAG TPA: hypothetical protein VFO91_01445, partial [Anaerolineales bacterium]|nr:hypothetical protein [Anaerolineales bacterium]
LVCAIDGASPQLQACLMGSLGEAAYFEIGSSWRDPTGAELQSSRPCLDQYGDYETPPTPLVPESPDDDFLAAASSEVQACARERLGDDTYTELYHGQRMPTRRETRRINACIRQERRNARLNHPGIGADLMPVTEGFSTEQWEGLIRFLLPGESLQRMTESALDQASAYLDGETDRVAVSIADLKARLKGQAGEDLILFLLDAQPSCTAEQIARIDAGGFENGGGTAIYCAASGDTLAKMIPGMRIRLHKIHAELPDEVVLIQSAASDGPDGMIRAARSWLRFGPLLPLALLLLVTVFAVRSVRGWLRWWGIPLLSAGLIGLGIGIAVRPLLDWAWFNGPASSLSFIFPSVVGELGYAISHSLAGELGQQIMLIASLITVLGLAAVFLTSRMGPKPDHTPRSFLPPEVAPGPKSRGDDPPDLGFDL